MFFQLRLCNLTSLDEVDALYNIVFLVTYDLYSKRGKCDLLSAVIVYMESEGNVTASDDSAINLKTSWERRS